MEEKLLEFRARKRREELLNKPKEFFQRIMEVPQFFSKADDQSIPLLDPSSTDDTARASPSSPKPADDELSIASSNMSTDFSINWNWTPYDFVKNIIYILLWITLLLIAIQLQFGFVYGILSGLVFMYFSTATGPKKDGQMSAYSVFNPGCESIDGTLKAEQFEKEFNLIRHDPNSPKATNS